LLLLCWVTSASTSSLLACASTYTFHTVVVPGGSGTFSAAIVGG